MCRITTEQGALRTFKNFEAGDVHEIGRGTERLIDAIDEGQDRRRGIRTVGADAANEQGGARRAWCDEESANQGGQIFGALDDRSLEIGRASCRERVCQYV